MEKFKAKTVILLRRGTKQGETWEIRVGRAINTWCSGFYLAWQKIYRTLEDKDRITKIEITVTREQ